MRAALYYRLSASRLGADAPGLDRQRGGCGRLVRERGWELVGEFQDADISAWKARTPRPGWDALQESVRAGGVDVVVTWKLDRAFRRLKEAVDFLDFCQGHGVAYVSVTEGIDTTAPFGAVLFALFSAIAQLESMTRSDRSVAWHNQRAQAGLPAGGGTRAFGWEIDGTTPVPEEQGLIRQGASDLLAGGSLAGVVRSWNESGIKTPTGGRWQNVTVRRIVLSPRIAGMREHNGEVFPGTWEGIVSQDDHLRLQALYSAPGTQILARRYLLTGMAECGLCGDKLIARPKSGGRRCYVCASQYGGCGKIRIIADTFEEYVAGEVNRHYEANPAPAASGPDPQALRAQLAADEDALDELARDRYSRRTISDAEFRAARGDLVARIAECQESLAHVASPRWAVTAHALAGEAPWQAAPGTNPDAEVFAQWREWVANVVSAVEVGPAIRGQNFFNPDRVEIHWHA